MPDPRRLDEYVVTEPFSRVLRLLGKFGVNLADFAGLTTASRFDGFGNGNGYTVSNWISDGVFANLAAVQAVYPIVQNGNDHVDWVLTQSAVDFLLFGALDGANSGQMKRKLIVPAGHYLLNRTINIGHGGAGTPPAGLNSNRYVGITIEGEGPQYDPTQGGLPGTTFFTEDYTYPGFALTRNTQTILRGFTLCGPNTGWAANNNPYRAPNNWDVAAWKNPACDSLNYVGGHAVNIGIGVDIYSDIEPATAYPARILPAAYGGGTGTTSGYSGAGGSDILIEDVNVVGFVIGIGHPYGDANSEFIRVHRGKVTSCTYGVMMGHSQNRNPSIVDTDISACHTAITTRGGTRGNAQMTGVYQNVHFGQCYQLVDHSAADWSGPVTLRDCYAESFSRIGTWNNKLKLSGCTLSFIEQEAIDGVPPSHFTGGRLILDNTGLGGLRHGLFFDSVSPNSGASVEFVNGSGISGTSAATNYGNLSEPALSQVGHGIAYMNSTFTPITGSANRVMVSANEIHQGGYGGRRPGFRDERQVMTFLDQLWQEYSASHPNYQPDPSGSMEMQGSVQNFPVPHITQWQLSVTVTARTGFDITCNRTAIGDLKADVGDMFGFEPTGAVDSLKAATWFVCISVTTSEMVLRQLNNYQGTSRYDYNNTGYDYYQIGTGGHLVQYVCTRIRSNIKLFVGDVENGSNVITNIRHAFAYGSLDHFTADNFNTWVGMKVGDYFLHQEIDRANTGGSGLKVANRVSAIDFTANSITLTENFNITRKNYPIVFFVKVFNA